MKNWLFMLMGVPLLFLSGCQADTSVCPPVIGTPRYLTLPLESIPTTAPEDASEPVPEKIGGKIILIDKVIEGPLCNDTWSGTVYVTCNVQVYPWIDQPTFLKDCSLSIAPGTVVYVAYHNDAAYYNGCSCHTGEVAGP